MFITIAVFAAGYVLLLVLAWIYARLTCGKCTCNVYLGGKTALITGGNSGIGYQTAAALAARGCRVIVACRSGCDAAKERLIKETGNPNVVAKHLDLTSFSSIRKLAKELNQSESRLDILINNAGGVSAKNTYTEDGLNAIMQVNHFGPFLLTHLLTGLLKKSAPSRIIFVSSVLAHLNNLTLENLNYPKDAPDTGKSVFMAYVNAKLCNMISANEFATKLAGTGVTANFLHPGLVNTSLFEKGSSYSLFRMLSSSAAMFLAKSEKEGAQTSLHLALSRDLDQVTGKFFCDCKISKQPIQAAHKYLREKIWNATVEYVKLSPEEQL